VEHNWSRTTHEIRKGHPGQCRALCAVGHPDKREYSGPRDERSIRCRRLAGHSWHSVGGIRHSHEKSVGHQSGVYELPRVRLSGAASTATEIIEPRALGWLDVREVQLRNGQMGSLDYPSALVEPPYR